MPPTRSTCARSLADCEPDGGALLGLWTVALAESRGIGREVGLVGLDQDSAKLAVSQLPDSQTCLRAVHWLHQRPPSTLLLLAPAAAHAPSILHLTLKHLFPSTPIRLLPRSAFCPEKGWSLLNALAAPGPHKLAALSEVRQKYYALAAASAVLEFVQRADSKQGQLSWAPGCLNLAWINVEGTMLLDRNSLLDLELIRNAVSHKSKQSLLGLLDHTFTPMASRLLRTNLLGPSTEVDVIDARLDTVQELVQNEDCFSMLRKALKQLGPVDLDKLIGSIASTKTDTISEADTSSVTGGASSLITSPRASASVTLSITKKLEMLRALQTVLSSLKALVAALSSCSTDLPRAALRFLKDPALDEMAAVIADEVNQDSFIGIQKGGVAKQNIHAYAIKTGPGNQLLDVARETYKENLKDAIEICEELRQRYKLPRLQIKFETRSGFILSIKKEHLRATSSDSGYNKNGLPSIFTNVVTKGKAFQFTCLDLKKKNQLIGNSYQEICLLSDNILDRILDKFKQRISSFYRVSESIALMDMLTSFAQAAAMYKYVRPEFTDTLAISNGRHPIKERYDSEANGFIPNDTYANESSSFQVITGPNMSGKSIFLRQISLMAVMSQIGSFCSAEYASFPIFDGLLTCLSKNDDIEANLSTFSSEMRNMSGILSALSVCKNALIIIDELGRGTSPIEGVGLAQAFSEEIINTRCFCFFATHFRELNTTLSVYPNVVCLHFETSAGGENCPSGMTFYHKVKEGPSKQVGYGIELARMAALPADIIQNAILINEKMVDARRKLERESRSNKVLMRRKVILDVHATLKNLRKYSKLSSAELGKFLRSYQRDTIDRLDPDTSEGSQNASVSQT